MTDSADQTGPDQSEQDQPTTRIPPHQLAAARLRAVQALYTLEQDQDATVQEVVSDFVNRVRHEDVDDDGSAAVVADADLMGRIIRGVMGRTEDIDGIVQGGLSEKHSVGRLESVLRQILRAGVFELLMHHDTPAPIIINDYIEIGHAFYEGKEPKLVNAVLDKASKVLRG
ncbi:MAG: transcription antitermination factor NusB [Alphaproteobacteria bacterium]